MIYKKNDKSSTLNTFLSTAIRRCGNSPAILNILTKTVLTFVECYGILVQ